MKKLSTLLLFIGMSVFVFGQTFILEDFSAGEMPPSGWSIDDLQEKWSINSGTEAGGIAPEAKFTYLSGNNTTRLISPETDLTGFTSASFSFRHFLDDYSGSGYTLGAATRSGGGAWNDVWSVNPTGDIGPEELSFEINNGDMGASDFQICLYVTGNTYNLDYWYIDDILLFNPLALDAQMVSITTSSYVGGPTEVEGIVKNFGSTQITSLDIDWEVDGMVHSTSITGLSIDFGENYDFTCDDLFNFPIGSYDLIVTILNENGTKDDDPRVVQNRIYHDGEGKPSHVEMHVVTRNADGTPKDKIVGKFDWPA